MIQLVIGLKLIFTLGDSFDLFTGELDVSGKEIYTNDIVVWHNRATVAGTVIFDSGAFRVGAPYICALVGYDWGIVSNVRLNNK